KPSTEAMKIYEATQLLALRVMTSAPRNTSAKALHKILQVEPFAHRAMDMNAMWGSRLHNSTNRTVPAVRIWRNALVQPEGPRQVCLPRMTATLNPLWRHPEAEKLDHTTNPLQVPPMPAPPYAPPPRPPRLLNEETRHRLRREAIAVLDNALDNVAGAILVEPDDKIRPFLLAKSGIDRKTRNTVLRWTIGAVAWHRPCLNCGEDLSRAHAAECSGADALLAEKHPEVAFATGRRTTRIDAVLNYYRNTAPSKTVAYSNIAAAIRLIYTVCLHYNQQENGHWVDDDAPARAPLPRAPYRRQQPDGRRQLGRPRQGPAAGIG
ncbi:hypothetical protein HDU82_003242, partial [Entophlyctis luteolus]